MSRFLKLLIVLLLIPSTWAFAQDEDDEFFEDEGYDEPVETVPPVPSPESSQRPFVPPNGQFRPPILNGSGNNNDSLGGGGRPPRSSFGAGEGPVEFVLIEPPKYWKPKKRKRPALRR
jgi:hypothetical protein